MIMTSTLHDLLAKEFDDRKARVVADAIVKSYEEGITGLVTKEHLDAALARVQADLIKWMFLFIMGQTALILGAGYFFLSHLPLK